MMRGNSRLALFLFLLTIPSFAQTAAPTSGSQPLLLLRCPSLSQDRIAFRYADDVWTVNRDGGVAERLTSNGAVKAGPYFSPDGSQIAFSALLQGNTDVYIIP